jgi:DNA invertase Pin-like site-specific DNA recombinase
MAATAQAQAEATKEAQQAGIQAAKGNPVKYRGKKPSYDQSALDLVLELTSLGQGTTTISKATGLSRQTVLRIGSDPIAAQSTLEKWNI